MQHSTHRSMGIESYCQIKENEQMHDNNPIKADLLNMSFVALKEENHRLQKIIQQKDLAVVSLREQNGDLKDEIAKLGTRVTELEKDVLISGDTQLYKMYNEVLAEKEELAQRMVTRDFSRQSNERSTEVLHQSYESLKSGQFELVEMNKKLILTH